MKLLEDRSNLFLFVHGQLGCKKTILLNQWCLQWISMGELHNPSKVKSPFWVVAKWSFYSTPSIDHPRFEAWIATGFCSHVKTSVRESPGDITGVCVCVGCWVFFHGFGVKICQLLEIQGSRASSVSPSGPNVAPQISGGSKERSNWDGFKGWWLLLQGGPSSDIEEMKIERGDVPYCMTP